MVPQETAMHETHLRKCKPALPPIYRPRVCPENAK